MNVPDKKQLHGAIVGLGSIGNRHMNNLARRIDRLTIVRRKSSNPQFQPLADSNVVHTIEDAIAMRPDFAVICSPSHMHVAHAQQLLCAGIPSLIEKPLAATHGADVSELMAAIDQSEVGKKCAMAYCMRYHAAYRTARSLVPGETIGKLLYAKVWFEGFLPAWHPWEDHRQSYVAKPASAGGALRTLDHEIDFLNWVCGPTNHSTGTLHNTASIGIDADDVAMITSLHNGVSSQATLSLCRNPASRGFEFIGDSGVLRYTMESGRLTIQSPDGTSTVVHENSADHIEAMYVDLIDDYLKLLENQPASESIATVTDAVAALKVIDDVTGSAQTEKIHAS